MTSETFLNVYTGISQGRFDRIYLRTSQGQYVDLLSLLGSGGSGSGIVTSASAPLAVTAGNLTIDLSTYLTSSQITAAIANALSSYSLTSALNSGSLFYDKLTLRHSGNDKDLTHNGTDLLWNGMEVQLRQNAFHSISVAAPLTVSGANSIVINTLCTDEW